MFIAVDSEFVIGPIGGDMVSFIADCIIQYYQPHPVVFVSDVYFASLVDNFVLAYLKHFPDELVSEKTIMPNLTAAVALELKRRCLEKIDVAEKGIADGLAAADRLFNVYKIIDSVHRLSFIAFMLE